MRTVASLVAVAALTVPAAAADWGGFYGGLSAAYGAAEYYWADTGAPTIFDDLSGGMLGAQLGYNWQFDGAVLGVEGSASLGNISQEIMDIPIAGESITFKVDALASVRARAGLDLEGFLPYLSAGVMVGHGKASTAAYGGETDEATHFGYTAGIGLERALTDTVSVRAEYAYGYLEPAPYTNGGVTQRAGIEFHTLRAGVNLHF